VSSQVRAGYCPVGDTRRPLQPLGTAEALSGYDVSAWECQACTAVVHVPEDDAAPFDRHRRVNCPIECPGKGTSAVDS